MLATLITPLRTFATLQDCSSAFASLTWHIDSHRSMMSQRAVPTLLEMSKLEDNTIRSNVAIALCNLCHSDGIIDELVECDVVPVLITLAQVRRLLISVMGRFGQLLCVRLLCTAIEQGCLEGCIVCCAMLCSASLSASMCN
jgi:hypothetical protein